MKFTNIESDLMSKEPLASEQIATPVNEQEPIATPEMNVADFRTDNIPDAPKDWFLGGAAELNVSAGFEEAAALKWEMESENRVVNQIARTYDIYDYGKEGDMLTVEQLNTQYPGYSWKHNTSTAAAKSIYNGAQNRARKQAIIDNADVNTLGKIALWGTGMISQLMDPVAVTAMVTTAGIGEAAVALYGVKSVTGKFAMSVAENALGAMAIEPFNKDLADAEQRDYGIGDYTMNVAGTAIIGTAGFKGLGLAFKGLGLSAKLGARLTGKLSDAALMAIETGKPVGQTLDALIADMSKGLDKTNPAFIKSVEDAFPDRAAAYMEAHKTLDEADSSMNFEGGSTMLDTMEMIGRDFEEGKITEADFSNFIKNLKDNNLEKSTIDSLLELGDGMHPDYVAKMKQNMSDPDTDLGVNLKDEQIVIPNEQQLKVEVSKTKMDADNALARMSQLPEEFDPKVIEEYQTIAKREDSMLQGAREYAGCIATGGI